MSRTRMQRRNQQLHPRRVSEALYSDQTVEHEGWLIRINADTDMVEVFPPEESGHSAFEAPLAYLDSAVNDFCREAAMPIPSVNETQGDQVKLPGSADTILGEDSSVGEGPSEGKPKINKLPKGLDPEGTKAPNTDLGPDSTDKAPSNFSPAVNERPMNNPLGRGGPPDTGLGSDTTGAPTNWRDKVVKIVEDGKNARLALHDVKKPRRGPGQLGVGKAQVGEEAAPMVDGSDGGEAEKATSGGAPSDGDVPAATASPAGMGMGAGRQAQSETFLSSPEDMEWLRDVHLPELDPYYQSAAITGNEDSPEKIEVFVSADPNYDDAPDKVYILNEDYEGYREARQVKGDSDPFDRPVVEEPGKKLNTGETPTPPEKVVHTTQGEGKDEKDETEGQDKKGRFVDSFENPTPDASHIYRQMSAKRPSEEILKDIMDESKWAANNIALPKTAKYEVVVGGDVGVVYSGDSFREAEEAFDNHVVQSVEEYGRAAGKSVSIFEDGELMDEHNGMQSIDPTDVFHGDPDSMGFSEYGNRQSMKDIHEVIQGSATQQPLENIYSNLADWSCSACGIYGNAQDARTARNQTTCPSCARPIDVVEGKGAMRRIATLKLAQWALGDNTTELAMQALIEAGYDPGLAAQAAEQYAAGDALDAETTAIIEMGLQEGTMMTARRQAGPRLKENWGNDGGYGRDLEAENAEELHALTLALGGEEVDWAKYRPQMPGEEATDETAPEVEAAAEQNQVPMPESEQATAPPVGTSQVQPQARRGSRPFVREGRKQAAFMEPQVWEGDFVVVEDHGDTVVIEEGYEDPEDTVVEKIHGWGAQMSAPGYMDRTDLSVYDTEEEAIDSLFEYYMTDMGELDPEYEEYRAEYEAYAKRQGWDKDAQAYGNLSEEESAQVQAQAGELAENWMAGERKAVIAAVSEDPILALSILNALPPEEHLMFITAYEVVAPNRNVATVKRAVAEGDIDAGCGYPKRKEKEAEGDREDKEAVDEAAKDYWEEYYSDSDYGKALTKDEGISKDKGKKDKGKGDKGKEARRAALLRAREAQAAPIPQPAAPAPAPATPAPAPAAPAPGASPIPGGAPAPKGPPAGGLPPGTGDQGLQSLGWTAEDISLMDEEDKKKVLQVQLSKPGTKKAPQVPGEKPATPAPPAPAAPVVPAAPAKPPAPVPPPPVAARMAKLLMRKLNQRRVLKGQAVAPVPTPGAPAAKPPAPAAPTAPAPAPTAPGATPSAIPSGVVDQVEDLSNEERAFQILSEVQQMAVEASTPEQVTSIKASKLAQRLLTELGMTMTEARELFGLASNKSFSSLLQ